MALLSGKFLSKQIFTMTGNYLQWELETLHPDMTEKWVHVFFFFFFNSKHAIVYAQSVFKQLNGHLEVFYFWGYSINWVQYYWVGLLNARPFPDETFINTSSLEAWQSRQWPLFLCCQRKALSLWQDLIKIAKKKSVSDVSERQRTRVWAFTGQIHL